MRPSMFARIDASAKDCPWHTCSLGSLPWNPFCFLHSLSRDDVMFVSPLAELFQLLTGVETITALRGRYRSEWMDSLLRKHLPRWRAIRSLGHEATRAKITSRAELSWNPGGITSLVEFSILLHIYVHRFLCRTFGFEFRFVSNRLSPWHGNDKDIW